MSKRLGLQYAFNHPFDDVELAFTPEASEVRVSGTLAVTTAAQNSNVTAAINVAFTDTAGSSRVFRSPNLSLVVAGTCLPFDIHLNVQAGTVVTVSLATAGYPSADGACELSLFLFGLGAILNRTIGNTNDSISTSPAAINRTVSNTTETITFL